MEHEYPANWKQLGDLANGILRSLAEKRMKQAEFLASETDDFHAELHSPRAQSCIQPELPLFQQAVPLAELRAGRS